MTGRSDLIAALAERLSKDLVSRPALVAIDGIDAAGKTTFSDHLGAALRASGEDVVQVSIDGFHQPRDVRYARAETEPALSYYEDSFDYESFRRLVLRPLQPGGDRRITPRIFDHATDSPTEREVVAVGEGAIVLIDGIFLGRIASADSWDCRIYLHADRQVARNRGAARDRDLYGDASLDRYLTRYEPGQLLYHDEFAPADTADIVIDNTDPDRPVIVRD